MALLNATTVFFALIDYRQSLIERELEFPGVFDHGDTIHKLDKAIEELVGNIDTVVITAASCKM